MGVESFVNQVRNGTFQSAFTEYIDRAGKVFTPIKTICWSTNETSYFHLFVWLGLLGCCCGLMVVGGWCIILLHRWLVCCGFMVVVADALYYYTGGCLSVVVYGCWWLMHYIITQVAAWLLWFMDVGGWCICIVYLDHNKNG